MFPSESIYPPAWRAALAGLAALAVAVGIGRFAFTPVLPLMLDEQAVSISGGAWLASANYLGYLIGALSAIRMRMEPQHAIRSGLLIIALTTLAMALPLSLASWAVLRCVAGAASAWVLIAVSAWSLDLALRHPHGFHPGVVFSGVGSGIAGAGVLCMLLDDEGAAWSWAVFGLIALAASLLTWNSFSGGPAAAGRSERTGLHWNGEVLRLVASYALFGFGYIIPATFLPVMAQQELGDGPWFVWVWPLFGLAAALSVLPVAFLGDRIGNRRLWLCCHLVMAAGIVLPLTGAGLLAMVGAALAIGGTFMVITLAALQEARSMAGVEATGLMAAMTAAFAAGQILGPLSIGNGSFFFPLTLAALALLAGAVLLAWPTRARHLTQE